MKRSSHSIFTDIKRQWTKKADNSLTQFCGDTVGSQTNMTDMAGTTTFNEVDPKESDILKSAPSKNSVVAAANGTTRQRQIAIPADAEKAPVSVKI